MDIPTGFDFNEFSFSNTNVFKLYDVLSVIDYSIDLIKNKGRHEFQAVIIQQLRMIYTEGNDYYDPKSPKIKTLKDNKNSFSLFDIIADYHITDMVNNDVQLKEATLFPKVTLKRRSYEELLEEHRFYYYTNESINEEKILTFDEFLNQKLVEVTDANGKTSSKNIKQCIKMLANKAQGAHYQVHIRNIEYEVIRQLDIISQTLGEITLQVLMPICKQILLNDDKEYGGSMSADYMERKKFIGLNIYNVTPIFDEN